MKGFRWEYVGRTVRILSIFYTGWQKHLAKFSSFLKLSPRFQTICPLQPLHTTEQVYSGFSKDVCSLQRMRDSHKILLPAKWVYVPCSGSFTSIQNPRSSANPNPKPRIIPFRTPATAPTENTVPLPKSTAS